MVRRAAATSDVYPDNWPFRRALKGHPAASIEDITLFLIGHYGILAPNRPLNEHPLSTELQTYWHLPQQIVCIE